MIHLDKVLSLKEPIIFTSHTILLFSDSSRITWHDSQLKIIIIYLLGPWRIFFSSPALKKNIYALSYSLPLSLRPHSLLSKLSSDWHRRSEQLVVFCLRERKYTHAHWSLEYSRLFSSSSRRKKMPLSFNQFGCFLVWKLQKVRHQLTTLKKKNGTLQFWIKTHK